MLIAARRHQPVAHKWRDMKRWTLWKPDNTGARQSGYEDTPLTCMKATGRGRKKMEERKTWKPLRVAAKVLWYVAVHLGRGGQGNERRRKNRRGKEI